MLPEEIKLNAPRKIPADAPYLPVKEKPHIFLLYIFIPLMIAGIFMGLGYLFFHGKETKFCEWASVITILVYLQIILLVKWNQMSKYKTRLKILENGILTDAVVEEIGDSGNKNTPANLIVSFRFSYQDLKKNKYECKGVFHKDSSWIRMHKGDLFPLLFLEEDPKSFCIFATEKICSHGRSKPLNNA